MITILDAVGYIAACLTTISFLPQVIQILKTKNTDGISLSMYVVFNTGLFMWLLYGIMKTDLPIIIANTVTLLFTLTILFLKIKDTLKK